MPDCLKEILYHIFVISLKASHKTSAGFCTEGKIVYKTSVSHTVEFLRLPWDLKLVIIGLQDRPSCHDQVSDLEI